MMTPPGEELSKQLSDAKLLCKVRASSCGFEASYGVIF
jgi:hypothetical protein